MCSLPASLAWLLDLAGYWSLPGILLFAFGVWMFVDAVRRGEHLWALFILLFPFLNALLYYFLVYRSGPITTQGFELPGAQNRRRIRELEAQIHHLDKAHHHSQLGDVHFQRGKLDRAEQCYRAALERDPADLDTRAHLGQCLLRQSRPAEARPILAQVCTEDPRHDYGHSLMALAETQNALGEHENAIATWQRVLQEHSYARARVQLADLYQATQQPELAAAELREVLADDAHAPTFQRKRDRVWVRRAKTLLRRLR